MSRVRAFFLEEAAECLATLKASMPAGGAEAGAWHGAARRLRGSAQVARYGPVAAAAGRLERRLKRLAGEPGPWTDAEAAAVAHEVGVVEAVVRGVEEGRIRPDERMEDRMEQNEDTAAIEVAIEELEYRGTAALDRAMDLRGALEDAIVEAQPIGPIMDELFDLIRLGMSDRG